MLKRVVLFTSVTLVLGLAVYFLQSYLIDVNGLNLTFSINKIYIFHSIAFVIIVLLVELLNKRLPSQVGFFYLTTVFVKIGLFVLVFSDTMFNLEEMAMQEKLQLLLPFFLFLIIEATYCGKLMNEQ